MSSLQGGINWSHEVFLSFLIKYVECSCFIEFIKETRSVSMNIFRKKKYFLFKSFVKIEFSYVFTINTLSTTENCMAK